LEEYLQCPFKHFASYGLKLSAQRGPAPTALELGSAAHEILAAVVCRAVAESLSVRELSDEQWLALLHEAIRAYADGRADDFARRQPRAAFLMGALPPFLNELVRAHAERWRRGLFEPWACERRFDAAGQGDALAALELKLADQRRVRLRGAIDRIDVCLDEGRRHVLVYDYKSSPRNVKAAFLTRDRLQLFTYLLAVAQAFDADPQTQVAGVFLAPLYPLTGVVELKSAASLPESELRMLMFRPRGLFDADVAPLLDRDSERNDSPVAAMKRKKDGDFDRWSDAVPRAELESRLWLARDTVLHAAEGLAGGRIDVAPLLENKTLACTTCEFRALCRYEPVFNRPRVAAATLPVLARKGEDEAGVTE
jgi:ATP-dependent helicase/nuclease subunit B